MCVYVHKFNCAICNGRVLNVLNIFTERLSPWEREKKITSKLLLFYVLCCVAFATRKAIFFFVHKLMLITPLDWHLQYELIQNISVVCFSIWSLSDQRFLSIAMYIITHNIVYQYHLINTLIIVIYKYVLIIFRHEFNANNYNALSRGKPKKKKKIRDDTTYEYTPTWIYL